MYKKKVFQSDLLTAGGLFLKPTEIPEATIATRFGKAVAINDSVIVCGGDCEDPTSERIVQVYNVLKEKWSTLPPSPYSYSGVTIIKDQLTLIGGRDGACINGTTNKLVTWTGVWSELYPPMRTTRRSPGVLAIGDLVIVSGGGGADDRDVNTIEFLDIKNRKWIQSNLKLPLRLSYHHMALCGEYIYIYNYDGYFWRMNKKNFMASLTNNEVHQWEELEKAPKESSLIQYSVLPVLVGPYGIFIFEKKKWTQISEETSYDNTCTASLNGTTFLTIGGRLGVLCQTRAVQYDIAVEEKEMKEKQTLIDQVERLKRSEREYELKVQELMKRNTQLETEVTDSSSKGTQAQQKNIDRLEGRIAELTRELRDTQKDNLQLRELITELKESKSELKDSISELRKTNTDLKESNSQSTEKMTELTRELKDAQTNVEKLEIFKIHLEQRIDDLNKTNSLLDKGNSELEARLQQQQQSTEKVAKLQEENIKLREEKSFLEGSLKETEERRNALEEEKAKTEKQAEELRSNMLRKVEGFGAMLVEMKKSLDVLEEKQSKVELMSTELTTRHMNVLLRNVIDKVPQKWEEIAICLEFEDNKITSLKDPKLNNKDLCKEMLRSWLRKDKDTGNLQRSLKTLCNALVERDCRPQAEKLVDEVKGHVESI